MNEEKQVLDYVKKVLSELNRTGDTTKAMRRFHIKMVHLQRRGNYRQAALLYKLSNNIARR